MTFPKGQELDALLSKLTMRQEFVIRMYYGLGLPLNDNESTHNWFDSPHTDKEVGAKFCCGGNMANYHRRKALKRLKNIIGDEQCLTK